MAMNTTKTINRASAVLMPKVEKTEKEMKRKMANAGCPDAKMVKMAIPRGINEKDDVVFVGLNGEGFYFLRGKTATMPEPIAEILENTGILNQ